MQDSETTTALAVSQPARIASAPTTVFSSIDAFVGAQRMARALCSSDLVPEAYRGPEKTGNALVALEMAQRMGASALAVMQNLNVIHGRPSWSSTFIIAAIASCGRFSPLRFRMAGDGDSRECIAVSTDLQTGELLEGPPVSIAMAKAEGWVQKSGSKWKTMPELMLRYRAAAFFGRLYAPDVLNGMQTRDEIDDAIDVTPRAPAPVAVQSVDSLLAATEPAAPRARAGRSAKVESVVEVPPAAPDSAPLAPQAAAQAAVTDDNVF